MTQVAESIRAAALSHAVVLSDSNQEKLFDLVMGVSDAYAYTLELIEKDHQLRLANIQAQVRFLENVRNIANSLLLSGLSPLTPQERLAESRRQYDTLVGQLESGDYSNAGNFQTVAQNFLTEASNVFASSDTYLTLFAEVMSQLAKFEDELGSLPSAEDRQQASFDEMIRQQESAALVLEQQLALVGKQVNIQMTLLDVMRNLPVELAQALTAVVGTGFMDNLPNSPILPNGSHSAGLAYVPYDGYTATLHKGEEIVPSSVRRKDDATREMVAELRQLRAEVSKLREEQRKHKEDMIHAQFASTDAAANKTVQGTKQVAKESEWDRQREVKLK
jgi:hypothetical protein